jgi:enoyl-CoA hydratase
VSCRVVASLEENILHLKIESDGEYPRLESGVMAEIARQMEWLGPADEAIACVISGNQISFVTGAEISELANLPAGDALEFARAGQHVLAAVAQSAKPVVAAIRGFCMGGGLDLALACRARIATPDAVFAHPGGALGIMTGWGGTQRLPRLVGRGRAMEMLLAGEKIGVTEALKCGLIAQIVEPGELLDAASLLAKNLAANLAPSAPHAKSGFGER